MQIAMWQAERDCQQRAKHKAIGNSHVPPFEQRIPADTIGHHTAEELAQAADKHKSGRQDGRVADGHAPVAIQVAGQPYKEGALDEDLQGAAEVRAKDGTGRKQAAE
ncbi:hypothetical protein D9M72_318670 [compost metagenome]